MCECCNDTMTIEKHEAHDTVELETNDYLAWLAREKQKNKRNKISLYQGADQQGCLRNTLTKIRKREKNSLPYGRKPKKRSKEYERIYF